MPLRTTTLLTAAVATIVIVGGGASAAIASSRFEEALHRHGKEHEEVHTTPDASRAHELSGVPAPLFRTKEQLEAGSVIVRTGDVLIVSSPDGTQWTGGSAVPAIAQFRAAQSSDGVDFNAGFTFTKPGTTTAWVSDRYGHRTTFTVTVTDR